MRQLDKLIKLYDERDKTVTLCPNGYFGIYNQPKQLTTLQGKPRHKQTLTTL